MADQLKAVILVGGQGTRLRPLTLTTPKPLVPLANRPVIEHIVRWLERYKVAEIILATQYRAADFAPWLKRWRGVRVLAIEEPEPRGTAGAVANVAALLRGTTVVVNGDNLTDLDLRAMLRVHRSAGAAATISTDAVDDPTGRGVVVSDADGRVLAFQEKPAPGTARANTVNTGVYLLEPAAIAAIPSGHFANFEQHVFPQLINAGAPVYAFRSDHIWIDTGTPAGYLQAQAAVLRGVASAPEGRLINGVWQSDAVTLDATAQLIGPAALGTGTMIAAQVLLNVCSVGSDCQVQAGTQIIGSAVWDNARIEAHATIRNSIIGYNCYVGAGAQLDAAVVGDGCIIRAGTVVPPETRLLPNTTID